MEYYCFELKPNGDSDQLWKELTELGYHLLYTVEEPGFPARIYGHLPKKQIPLHEGIASVTAQTFEYIDWQTQWSEIAGRGEDGILHLNLADFLPGCSSSLQIFPGPGFGDLSHPTTQQILRLMAPRIEGKFFLDLGCGSGILSLAAAQLGALRVHGIDIDHDALTHARGNAGRNELKSDVTFGLPSEYFEFELNKPLIIAMNMIFFEQKLAWKELSLNPACPAEIFTSGILVEQREEYLAHCQQWGWQLLSESSLDGWQAFSFKTCSR